VKINKETQVTEQPLTGKDALLVRLNETLDASGSFYDALMYRVREMFEPSIRSLAERVALGRPHVH
jgi:hypothetical protein